MPTYNENKNLLKQSRIGALFVRHQRVRVEAREEQSEETVEVNVKQRECGAARACFPLLMRFQQNGVATKKAKTPCRTFSFIFLHTK